MQLQEGQRIKAPFLPHVAEVLRFEPRAGYALLQVVLQDGQQTFRSLTVTGAQLATIEVLSIGCTLSPRPGQMYRNCSGFATRRRSFRSARTFLPPALSFPKPDGGRKPMTDPITNTPDQERIERLRRRLGKLDRRQIDAWRAMTPVRRLEMAFQAYQFALDAVRLTERRRHPDLPPDELAWRVTRRMQGNYKLGR